jgi:hypothetical protein
VDHKLQHNLQHGALHLGHDILKEKSGLAGAAVGAVVLPISIATLATISAPVVIGLAALGACMGWHGLWKTHKK